MLRLLPGYLRWQRFIGFHYLLITPLSNREISSLRLPNETHEDQCGQYRQDQTAQNVQSDLESALSDAVRFSVWPYDSGNCKRLASTSA